MVDIVQHRGEDFDITSLATLTRSVYMSEGRGDYTLEQIERYLKNMNERFPLEVTFLAFKENMIVGWIGVERKTESIGELGRWYPFVSDIPDRDEIAKLLISEVMRYAIENGMTRLEISFGDISDDSMMAYNKRCSWFKSNNWSLVEDTFYMNKDASEEIPEVNTPDGFGLHPLLENDDDALYSCHYASFTSSEAREFYGLSEDEKRQHFDKLYDRTQSINAEASLVLKKDDEIASILLTISRENEEHFSVVAVHPSYRGMGLAKALLTTGIQKVREQGVENISIGVDVVNTPAVNLYRKYGFKVASRLSFHSWKAT